jgi:hypothetical protein
VSSYCSPLNFGGFRADRAEVLFSSAVRFLTFLLHFIACPFADNQVLAWLRDVVSRGLNSFSKQWFRPGMSSASYSLMRKSGRTFQGRRKDSAVVHLCRGWPPTRARGQRRYSPCRGCVAQEPPKSQRRGRNSGGQLFLSRERDLEIVVLRPSGTRKSRPNNERVDARFDTLRRYVKHQPSVAGG